jgi:hypothetical protein
MTAPYRACPTSRPRRSKAAIDDIKQTILDIVQTDPPMTVRQVFYQLVVRGAIDKAANVINDLYCMVIEPAKGAA